MTNPSCIHNRFGSSIRGRHCRRRVQSEELLSASTRAARPGASRCGGQHCSNEPHGIRGPAQVQVREPVCSPRSTLEQVRVPVLALFGALDLQVPPKPNRSAPEAAFETGGNTAVTIRVLENLNHLFQTAQTGRMEEYAVIEETFSPDAPSMISSWILEHTR